MEVVQGVEQDPNAWAPPAPPPEQAAPQMSAEPGDLGAASQGDPTGASTTLSKFRGVEWDKYVKKWRSRITIKGKKLSLGSYISEEDAARAYNEAIVLRGAALAQLNLGLGDVETDGPSPVYIGPSVMPAQLKQQLIEVLNTVKAGNVPIKAATAPGMDSTRSRFRGVTWDKRENKWRCRLTSQGQHIALGRYKSQVQAALAYDLKALEMLGRDAKLNFAEPVREKLAALLEQGADMMPLDHPDVLERLSGGDASAVDQVAAGMVEEPYYMQAPLAPPHLPGPMVVPHGLTGSDADLFIRKQLLNMAGFGSQPGLLPPGASQEEQLQLLQHHMMQPRSQALAALHPDMALPHGMDASLPAHMGASALGGGHQGVDSEHLASLLPARLASASARRSLQGGSETGGGYLGQPPGVGSHGRPVGSYLEQLPLHQQLMSEQQQQQQQQPGWHHHHPPSLQQLRQHHMQQHGGGGGYGHQPPPPGALGAALDLNQPAPGRDQPVQYMQGAPLLTADVLMQSGMQPRIGYYHGKPTLILTLPKGFNLEDLGAEPGRGAEAAGPGALGQEGGGMRGVRDDVSAAPDALADGFRVGSVPSLTPTYNQLLPKGTAQLKPQQPQQEQGFRMPAPPGAYPHPQQQQQHQQQQQQGGNAPGPFLRALMSVGTLPQEFCTALTNTAATVAQGEEQHAQQQAAAGRRDPLHTVQTLTQQFQQTRNLQESFSLLLKNWGIDVLDSLPAGAGTAAAVESSLKDIASVLLGQMHQALNTADQQHQQQQGAKPEQGTELQALVGHLRSVESLRRLQQQEDAAAGGSRKRQLEQQQQQQQQEEQGAKRLRSEQLPSGGSGGSRRSKKELAEKLARLKSPFAANPALFQEVSTSGATSGAVASAAAVNRHESISSHRKPARALAPAPHSFTIRRIQPASSMSSGEQQQQQQQQQLVLPASIAAVLSGGATSCQGAGSYVVAELAELPPGAHQQQGGMHAAADSRREEPTGRGQQLGAAECGEHNIGALAIIPLASLVTGQVGGELGQQLEAVMSGALPPAAAEQLELPWPSLLQSLTSQVQQRGALPEGSLLVQVPAPPPAAAAGGEQLR